MPETTAIRLKRIMNERRLKQADILRMCEPYCEKFNMKLSKSDLSQFVNGKVQPGQWKITILSLALNVSEPWLMGYDVSPLRDISERLDLQTFANTPYVPQTSQARIVSAGMDKMPEDARNWVLNMIKLTYKQYADYFKEGEHDDDT